ncbi:MAG: GHMP kinase, partial [Thermoplasmata archaeon]
MTIRSKAPLRISFGGGGTDISPYPEERGGVALNVTIDKYAYCTLVPRSDSLINTKSLDYDAEVWYDSKKDLEYDGKLDLVKAAIKVMKPDGGLNLFLHSDAPPGTGLGSSSTITVALVGAFKHHMRLPLTDYEIAESAYLIERNEVGIRGGKQDQYAATFGGFNFIEFLEDKVIVNSLRIRHDVLNELEYRLLLCYTGGTRLSAGIIEDQVARYIRGEGESVEALDKTKSLAIAMKNALLLGDLDGFGRLLGE